MSARDFQTYYVWTCENEPGEWERLGAYVQEDEDAVLYLSDATNEPRWAPSDCVCVALVKPPPPPVVRDPESWQAVAAEGRKHS